MKNIIQDIKLTFRNIVDSPTFYAAVILTLAIGIGANVAVFSIIKTVLVNPLPYEDSDQIIVIENSPWVPAEIFEGLKESNGGNFKEVAAYYAQPFTVNAGDVPYEVSGAWVTPNFFSIFKTNIISGRDFMDSDAKVGGGNYAIIDHNFSSMHGAKDNFLRVNETPVEVLGVTPPLFKQLTPIGKGVQIWIPAEFETLREDGSEAWVVPLMRVKANTSIAQAQAEFDRVMAYFRSKDPSTRDNTHWNSLKLNTLKSALTKNYSSALLAIQLAVSLLLIIACVNVANLLQAKCASRQTEFAIRSAIGATKSQIAKQLFTETFVVSVIGGILGLVLMLFTVELLIKLAPQDIPRIKEVGIDLELLFMTISVMLLTGLISGILPALVMTRNNHFESLGGRTQSSTKEQQRVSVVLVISEIALTLVLLVGAGLLVKSFFLLSEEELGFRTDNVMVASVNLPALKYENMGQLNNFYNESLIKIRQMPNIHSASITNNLPLNRANSSREIRISEMEEPYVAEYAVVGTEYFKTLDISLLAGRDFTDSDRSSSLPVVIVDEILQKKLWPKDTAIGQRIKLGDGNSWLSVIGVVSKSRSNGLSNKPTAGFYIPISQRADSFVEVAVGRKAHFIIRTNLKSSKLADEIRQSIWDIDPLQPVPSILPLSNTVTNETSPLKFRAVLLASFSVIALILVIAGIYGVVEFMVVEKTHEIGIRMAIGAKREQIVRMILYWGVKLAAAGVVIGLLGVFVIGKYLESLLFGVQIADVTTLAIAISIILLIILFACLIPAVKVAMKEPIIALRANGQVRK